MDLDLDDMPLMSDEEIEYDKIFAQETGDDGQQQEQAHKDSDSNIEEHAGDQGDEVFDQEQEDYDNYEADPDNNKTYIESDEFDELFPSPPTKLEEPSGSESETADEDLSGADRVDEGTETTAFNEGNDLEDFTDDGGEATEAFDETLTNAEEIATSEASFKDKEPVTEVENASVGHTEQDEILPEHDPEPDEEETMPPPISCNDVDDPPVDHKDHIEPHHDQNNAIQEEVVAEPKKEESKSSLASDESSGTNQMSESLEAQAAMEEQLRIQSHKEEDAHSKALLEEPSGFHIDQETADLVNDSQIQRLDEPIVLEVPGEDSFPDSSPDSDRHPNKPDKEAAHARFLKLFPGLFIPTTFEKQRTQLRRLSSLLSTSPESLKSLFEYLRIHKALFTFKNIELIIQMATEASNTNADEELMTGLCLNVSNFPADQQYQTYKQCNQLAATQSMKIFNCLLDKYMQEYRGDPGRADIGRLLAELIALCRTNDVKMEMLFFTIVRLFISKALDSLKTASSSSTTQQRRRSLVVVSVPASGGTTAAGATGRAGEASTVGARSLTLSPLECLLPCVALLAQLVGLCKVSNRSLYLDTFQELWFVLIYHGYQKDLAWPPSWLPHVSQIARYSPALIKDKERVLSANSAVSQQLLSLPVSQSLKEHVLTFIPKTRANATNLSMAQCLWLLSMHECEQFKVSLNNFDTFMDYLLSELVHSMGLYSFVEEMILTIVKGWLVRQSQILAPTHSHASFLLRKSVDHFGYYYRQVHITCLKLFDMITEHGIPGLLLDTNAIWHSLLDRLEKVCAISRKSDSFSRPPVIPKCFIVNPTSAAQAFDEILGG